MKCLLKNLSVILISASLLTACDPYHQNEDVGTVAGGLAGGLLGSTIGGGNGKAVAVGVGAIGGALLGNSIGRSMDQQNAQYYAPPPRYYPTNRGDYYYAPPPRGYYQSYPAPGPVYYRDDYY
ncbi:MAG: glycine zipper domain-containing protein [Gammaproteobacteria bacterium]|nr:glycine zipper domain-containing protein [Gammaproteobacteria bacterium]